MRSRVCRCQVGWQEGSKRSSGHWDVSVAMRSDIHDRTFERIASKSTCPRGRRGGLSMLGILPGAKAVIVMSPIPMGSTSSASMIRGCPNPTHSGRSILESSRGKKLLLLMNSFTSAMLSCDWKTTGGSQHMKQSSFV